MFSHGEVTMSSFANASGTNATDFQETQLKWFDAALDRKLTSFLIVEWDTARQAKGR
jgi:hypothetical protein